MTTVSKRHLRRLISLDVTWHLFLHETGVFYVTGWIHDDGQRRKVRLHRFITDCSDSEYVLHLDGNTLNNLDTNLVIAKRNRTGAKLKRQFKSGVGFDYDRLMWYAVVDINGNNEHIGYFLSEAKANEIFQQYNTSDV